MWLRRCLLAVLGMLTVLCFAHGSALAQSAPASKSETAAKSAALPRTADGHPDLQGTWTNQTLTPFQRPAQFANKEFFTEEEAAAYEKSSADPTEEEGVITPASPDFGRRSYNTAFTDRGTHVSKTMRTSMVIDPPDGRVPPMTPEAKKLFDEAHAWYKSHPADGPEDRQLSERCVLFPTAGPPMLPEPYNSLYEIVQTPNYVTIAPEMNHDVRMIPLDGRPHLPADVRQWKGDSRGHWEGDTLVVDTTNFTSNNRPRFGIVYDGWTDQNLHITERFTRTGPNTIQYRATIVDPTVYTKPWTLELLFTRRNELMYEYACHEGNYAMADILSGARSDEAKAASK